jgi:prefoldin subunit 5
MPTMPSPQELDSVLANLNARVAAVERSQADYRSMTEAIKAFGDTQQLLADVLRSNISEMRATADDSNQRIRTLEASIATIVGLLGQGLAR